MNPFGPSTFPFFFGGGQKVLLFIAKDVSETHRTCLAVLRAFDLRFFFNFFFFQVDNN